MLTWSFFDQNINKSSVGPCKIQGRITAKHDFPQEVLEYEVK